MFQACLKVSLFLEGSERKILLWYKATHSSSVYCTSEMN